MRFHIGTKHVRGVTLVEVLVTLGIFVVVMLAVGNFVTNIFIYHSNISSSYQTEQNAQVILKTLLNELREIAPGADGSYALVNAGSSTVTFFSDTKNSGVTQEVKYALVGTTLYKVVTTATGTPFTYSAVNRSTTTLLTAVQNGTTTPVFQYFDTNYNGTSSPLSQPVTTATVRLIKIGLVLNLNGGHTLTPVTYTVQVSPRNLKTNL